MLTRNRRRRPDPRAAEIAADDFFLVREDVERAYDLIAVCTAQGCRPDVPDSKCLDSCVTN
jgi:hypothetical protein